MFKTIVNININVIINFIAILINDTFNSLEQFRINMQ